MATTTNYNFTLPTIGASSDRWGSTLNAAIGAIDATIKTVADSVPTDLVTRAEFNGTIAGLSGSYATLNHTHSIAQVTGLRAELDSKLDGNPASEVTVGRLRIVSNADASLSSVSHGFQIGSNSFQNIIMDNNEIIARNNVNPSELLLNPDGGGVSVNRRQVYHAGNLSPSRIRDITVSTAAPSGGSDGDVWLQY